MKMVDALDALMHGQTLYAKDISSLENLLEVDESNLVPRLKLVGYYRMHLDKHLPEFARHLLWLAKHHPEEDLSVMGAKLAFDDIQNKDYKTVQEQWLANLRSPSVTAKVALMAADFLYWNKDYEHLLTCLSVLENLVPEKEYFITVSGLYEKVSDLDSKYLGTLDREELLAKAIFWNEEMLRVDSKNDKELTAAIHLLSLEYKVRGQQAKPLAIKLLAEANQNPEVYGYGIHIAHVTLGKISLDEGDISSAVRHLSAAAHVPNSTALYAVGPDMSLAQALLEFDKRESVCDFISQCEKLVLSDPSKKMLADWRHQIDIGRRPQA
jgi:hypothetical protein